MRRFLLLCAVVVLPYMAGFELARADGSRTVKADTVTCPSGSFSGQILGTLNPATTGVTDATVLANPIACGANELLIAAAVNGSRVASMDCEGDWVGVKGDFSGALHAASTFTADSTATMTGAVAFGASNTYQVGDIIAADIADVTRSVQLPLGSWVPCTGQGIWTVDNATGSEPNLTALNSGLAIVYDITAAHIDTDEICNAFTVPDGYVSGGAVLAEVIGGTTTNVETFSCRVSQNGGAVGSANAGNLASSAAKQEVTSTPVVTYVVGDAIALICKQGNASADDAVKILSTRWTYTATE